MNGLRVHTNEDYQFSYNIIGKYKAIQEAMNRDIARGIYSERVKKILMEIPDTHKFTKTILELYDNMPSCSLKKDLAYREVYLHFIMLLAKKSNKVVVTQKQTKNLMIYAEVKDQVVVVPEENYQVIKNHSDVPTYDSHVRLGERYDRIVDQQELTTEESEIFALGGKK